MLTLGDIYMKFSDYKARAKKKGISFTIDKGIFEVLISRPCYFCRINKKEVGIDRIDNSKGYESGNCISCCWDCNRSKSNKSMSEYRDYLLRFNPLIKIPKTPLVVHWLKHSDDTIDIKLAPFKSDTKDFYGEF